VERSKKVIFVSHCILNQNSRSLGTERSPALIKEFLELCTEANVGIVQIPCPQVEFNSGLHRRSRSSSGSKKYVKDCGVLSFQVLKQIENYIQKKYTVVGVVGVENSATCGVHKTENNGRVVPGRGMLFEELENLMHKKNYQVPIVGINLNNMYSSIEKVQSLLRHV